MTKLILTTEEELRSIILDCLRPITPLYPSDNIDVGENRQLNSIAELADFLNCSIASAQKIKNSGKIRYVQFGRKVRFNTKDILEDLSKGGYTL